MPATLAPLPQEQASNEAPRQSAPASVTQKPNPLEDLSLVYAQQLLAMTSPFLVFAAKVYVDVTTPQRRPSLSLCTLNCSLAPSPTSDFPLPPGFILKAGEINPTPDWHHVVLPGTCVKKAGPAPSVISMGNRIMDGRLTSDEPLTSDTRAELAVMAANIRQALANGSVFVFDTQAKEILRAVIDEPFSAKAGEPLFTLVEMLPALKSDWKKVDMDRVARFLSQEAPTTSFEDGLIILEGLRRIQRRALSSSR